MPKTTPDVLIVDRSAESREVLRTMLRREGLTTLEAHNGQVGMRLARQSSPRVVILDTDTIEAVAPKTCDDIGSALVVVGRISPKIDASSEIGPMTRSEILPKPYHYAPLLRKIEELLRHSDQQTE